MANNTEHFLCVYLPSVYVFGELAIQVFTNFKITNVEFWQFFIYSDYKFFNECVIVTIISQAVALIFILPNVFFLFFLKIFNFFYCSVTVVPPFSPLPSRAPSPLPLPQSIIVHCPCPWVLYPVPWLAPSPSFSHYPLSTSPLVTVSLFFLHNVLYTAKYFNFDNIQYLIFLFLGLSFSVMSKNSLPNTRSESFLLNVSNFTRRSMIHFELLFV